MSETKTDKTPNKMNVSTQLPQPGKPITQIDDQKHRLYESVSQNQALIQELEKRLSRILRLEPTKPQEPTSQKDNCITTPLANEIHEIGCVSIMTGDAIRDILNRIEV